MAKVVKTGIRWADEYKNYRVYVLYTLDDSSKWFSQLKPHHKPIYQN